MSQAPAIEHAAISTDAIASNAKRLLWAGFFAILTAGVGFAIRGGILADWSATYGFSATQNGEINGAGFTGFCFGIIIGGLVADKIGYGPLVIAAFLMHAASAVVSLLVPAGADNQTAYNFLYWGSFIFAIANGTLEGVANPLVATLFPHNRTHYLNILHASWPAGLVLGGFLGYLMGDVMHIGWKGQLGLFLVPTVIYGFMFFGQKMPKSEAAAKGLKFGDMLKDVGILGSAVACILLMLFFKDALKLNPVVAYGLAGALLLIAAVVTKFSFGAVLLFVLFVTHALVGAVELGTDGWIQNITGNILSPAQGKILFVWTSFVMFSLRFCAHWIEKNLKLSPVALLFVCSIVACVGLFLVSGISSFFMAMLALTIYAGGKTFFWPTMLAVASDRFPRTGAIAISIMGGIGMMSAGMIGSPGLGYAKDRFTAQHLQETPAGKAVFEANKGDKPSEFLFFTPVQGVDAKKIEEAKAAVKDNKATPEQTMLVEANQAGDRATLRADAFIPAGMAAIYVLMFLYFMSTGGYKPVHITTTEGGPESHGFPVTPTTSNEH
ncbi:MAG TPA: MFS transporter [Humisphaera sp.]